MDKKYDIIYADPPWYDHKFKKDKTYPAMKTQDIMNLDVASITNVNAHCYLWVNNVFFPNGLKVLREWGFEYLTCITWVKDSFGLGQYYRGQTEQCLFGVRGNIPYKISPDGKRFQRPTYFHAPRPDDSVKPSIMRDYISHVSDREGFNKVELFAKERVDGWDAWGMDIDDTELILTKKHTVFGSFDIFKSQPTE